MNSSDLVLSLGCRLAPQFTGHNFDAFKNSYVVSVDVENDEALELAKRLPSSTSSDYGKPFAEIFKEYKHDFYKIDKLLFSPANVIVTTIKTGSTYTEGSLNLDLIDKSFNK